MRLISSVICIFFAIVGAANAAILADSVADFSGVQGQESWYYGYYPGPFTPADFVQMTVFASNAWFVDNETVIDPDIYWTVLTPTRAHGNGTTTSGGRTPVEQWAVRRWIAEVTGPVQISGSVAKIGIGGNGIVARIFVNGTETFTQFIDGMDTTGINYSFLANSSAGDAVDFVLDPSLSNDWSDSTHFTAQVTSVVPEPATAVLAGQARR
jgi:hypothetical protein